MLEFITQNFNFIVYLFEINALIIGVCFLNKGTNKSTKIFVFYLGYIVFVELVAFLLLYLKELAFIDYLIEEGVTSISWFNLFWFYGGIMFTLFYYHSLLTYIMFKRILKIVAVLFSLIMLSHFLIFSKSFFTAHSFLYQISGLIVILICVTLYFIEFLNNENVLNIFHSFSFYVALGLFSWWLIITPVTFFASYNTSADWDFANLKRRIFLFANIFMYTCFAAGFIISKSNTNNEIH